MTFPDSANAAHAVPLMIDSTDGVFANATLLSMEGIMIFGFIGVLFVRNMQSAYRPLRMPMPISSGGRDWAAVAMLVAAALGALFSLLLSFASIG